MARGISTAAKAAASAGVVRPALFVRIAFDSGTWRTWTGFGEIEVDGEIYLGTGAALTIQLPSESADLTAHPLQATLSGLDGEMLALALAEPYQGRVVTIYQGFFDVAGQLVAPPDVWTRARLDQMTIVEAGDTSTIQITAETKLRDLRRPLGLFYTPEDQETLFPGDKFFEFVPTIRDIQTYWGTKDIDDT